jgi:hypothetical protein
MSTPPVVTDAHVRPLCETFFGFRKHDSCIGDGTVAERGNSRDIKMQDDVVES